VSSSAQDPVIAPATANLTAATLLNLADTHRTTSVSVLRHLVRSTFSTEKNGTMDGDRHKGSIRFHLSPFEFQKVPPILILICSTTHKPSSYLVDDSKYAFLRQLNLSKNSIGYDGTSWFGGDPNSEYDSVSLVNGLPLAASSQMI
jgi:hypothetical protein